MDKELAMVRADLMWCLGKLRGLGYPALQLEKKYHVEEQERTGQSEES